MLYGLASCHIQYDEFSRLEFLHLHMGIELASRASLIHDNPDLGSIPDFFQGVKIYVEDFWVMLLIIGFGLRWRQAHLQGHNSPSPEGEIERCLVHRESVSGAIGLENVVQFFYPKFSCLFIW